jgi:Rrf2 family protein
MAADLHGHAKTNELDLDRAQGSLPHVGIAAHRRRRRETDGVSGTPCGQPAFRLTGRDTMPARGVSQSRLSCSHVLAIRSPQVFSLQGNLFYRLMSVWNYRPPRTPFVLTNKGKYGLKALAHLARLRPGQSARAAEIASAHNIPKKFLDAILGELRREKIVVSRKGPGGGYALARDANEITLGEVVRVLDGPLAPIRCASRKSYRPCTDCRSVARCSVRLAMLEVRDAVAGVLDGTTLDQMLVSPELVRQADTGSGDRRLPRRRPRAAAG